jgi:thymidylate kinase
LPHVIVFVTGSPRVALQRINADKTRHGQWKVGDFPHETEHNLARLDRLYRRTVHLLKLHHKHGLELIEVNGERPVEETTRQILQRLRETGLMPSARSAHRHAEHQ